MNLIAQIDIGGEFNSPIGQNILIADLVSILLSNAVAIAAIIFFIMLIFGGISLIIGAGSDDPQKVAQGRKALIGAVVGFAIIFVSYWIIQLVEIVVGFNILSPVI